MNYLENNLQRRNLGLIESKIVSLIRKKHKVDSHYSLYLKYFIKLLGLENKKISICEIGGGDGWAISYKNKKITKKVMVDYDPHYQKILEKQDITFIKSRLGKERIPLNTQFDIVMLNHVIEHISEYEEAIKEIHRLTRKDGYVIVRCPNLLAKRNRWNYWNDFTHVKPYTPFSLESAFKSQGFKTVMLKKFSYQNFVIGFLLNDNIQNKISQINADEILYIGKKVD